MNVNAYKMKIAKSHLILLGHNITPRHYSLRTYIQVQLSKMPQASSKTELQKILDVFTHVGVFVLDCMGWSCRCKRP